MLRTLGYHASLMAVGKQHIANGVVPFCRDMVQVGVENRRSGRTCTKTNQKPNYNG
jgi:hypothetical protein